MRTGAIKILIDQLWGTFGPGGIAIPAKLGIEQIAYMIFCRLAGLRTLEQSKATQLKRRWELRVYPEPGDPNGQPNDDLRLSRVKNLAPSEIIAVLRKHVFSFLPSNLPRDLGTVAA